MLVMIEISVVGSLFLISLAANALVTRWSARKVLGIEVSIVKSISIVVVRSLAALLAGFSVGYGIRLFLQGEIIQQSVQIIGVSIVAVLSFIIYWALLGKMTNTSISFLGMTKTVLTESVMLFGVAVGIAIFLSLSFYVFN